MTIYFSCCSVIVPCLTYQSFNSQKYEIRKTKVTRNDVYRRMEIEIRVSMPLLTFPLSTLGKSGINQPKLLLLTDVQNQWRFVWRALRSSEARRGGNVRKIEFPCQSWLRRRGASTAHLAPARAHALQCILTAAIFQKLQNAPFLKIHLYDQCSKYGVFFNQIVSTVG